MEESLFMPYVERYFTPLVAEITHRVNGRREGEEIPYWFKQMLTPRYTPTLTWSSLSTGSQRVVADVVSMDSKLPLKRRDALTSAEGKVPKMGMMKYLGEEELTKLNILENTSVNGSMGGEIRRILFGDTRSCLMGVYEQQEAMFLQGFSTGVTSVEDPENEGVAIRLDYGYDPNHFSNVTAVWSGASATPIADITALKKSARADGNTLRYMFMGATAFENFIKHDDVKELYAAQIGFLGDNIPAPNLEQINRALSANLGMSIVVNDRSVVYEKNGVRTVQQPFDEANVVFTDSMNVGTVTWGTLAEAIHPVAGVTYTTADQYILLSKYRENNPLREFTSSQALAVPVINNVDRIYVLETETAD